MTAAIAISPALYTFVMLGMIALTLPVSFSCAAAPLRLLTSEQYAGWLPLAAGVLLALVLLAAGVALLLLAAVVLLLLLLPHPANNAAAVRVRMSTAEAR